MVSAPTLALVRPDFGRSQVRAIHHRQALLPFRNYSVDGLCIDDIIDIRTFDSPRKANPEGVLLLRDPTSQTATPSRSSAQRSQSARICNGPATSTLFAGPAGLDLNSQQDESMVKSCAP